MAISAVHYSVVHDLHSQGRLPRGGAILELGEANWYGDLDPKTLAHDIDELVPDPPRRDELRRRLDVALAFQGEQSKFDVAKVFYDIFYAPSDVQAIDLQGAEGAHRLDLNAPVTLEGRFDVTINHGTAEHIFNIAQVFATAHDYTKPGGMMMHEGPFTGWVDHGFYSFQPTLFFDLAAANGYHDVSVYVEDLVARKATRLHSPEAIHEAAQADGFPANAMLLVILHKSDDERPFEFPVLGCHKRMRAGGDFDE